MSRSALRPPSPPRPSSPRPDPAAGSPARRAAERRRTSLPWREVSGRAGGRLDWGSLPPAATGCCLPPAGGSCRLRAAGGVSPSRAFSPPRACRPGPAAGCRAPRSWRGRAGGAGCRWPGGARPFPSAPPPLPPSPRGNGRPALGRARPAVGLRRVPLRQLCGRGAAPGPHRGLPLAFLWASEVRVPAQPCQAGVPNPSPHPSFSPSEPEGSFLPQGLGAVGAAALLGSPLRAPKALVVP